MNFVADENVDRAIYERLRRDGHSVEAIAERSPGAEDPTVLALATRLDAVLVTADTDFGELVFRQGQASAGVLLVRVSGLTFGYMKIAFPRKDPGNDSAVMTAGWPNRTATASFS